MNESIPYLPGLSPVAGKESHARFDGGRLPSDGGVLLLREIEGGLAIAEAMRVLSTQKFFHLSAEIGRAAEELEKQLAAAAEKKLPEGSFERIAQWLVEINAIVGEQDFKSVVDIVARTREVLDSVASPGAEITARQLEILRLHGYAIGAVLRDSDDSAGRLVSALNKAAAVAKGEAKPG